MPTATDVDVIESPTPAYTFEELYAAHFTDLAVHRGRAALAAQLGQPDSDPEVHRD